VKVTTKVQWDVPWLASQTCPEGLRLPDDASSDKENISKVYIHFHVSSQQYRTSVINIYTNNTQTYTILMAIFQVNLSSLPAHLDFLFLFVTNLCTLSEQAKQGQNISRQRTHLLQSSNVERHKLLHTFKIATSFFKTDSSLCGKRNLSMTFIATSLPVALCKPSKAHSNDLTDTLIMPQMHQLLRKSC